MNSKARASFAIPTASRIAQTLVTDMSVIASPPEVYVKLNALIADERTSLDDVAAVVQRDPALVARVLRMANSPYYGLAARVDTIARAVNVLGMNELQKVVYTVSVVESFSRLSSRITNMNAFWRHGIYTALVAEEIATRVRVLRPERLFVGAVVHDIGTLVLNHRYPEFAEELITEAYGDETVLYYLERQELGFDHAQLGALMLDNWHLPQSLVDAVCWHHEPRFARHSPVEAAIVHMADNLANASGTGSFSELQGAPRAWDASLLTVLGLNVDFEPEQIIDAVDRAYIETVCALLA